MLNQQHPHIVQVESTTLPDWPAIAAAIVDAQQIDELERAAITALRMVLPRHQVSLTWVGQGWPEESPEVAVRVLGDGEQYGWLAIRPAELTASETAMLTAIERLIVAGYGRLLRRSERQGWRHRLRFEIEMLRDRDDPNFICRQLGQFFSELFGLLVKVGIVVPIKSSPWLELLAQYPEQPSDDEHHHRFWPSDTDLSSAVIKLETPISSVNYLADCARYDVRPHPDYLTPEAAPAY